MNIITKKVRLIPATFVGTHIKIALEDPVSLKWGMLKVKIAEGHEKAVIDWGDGVLEDLTRSKSITHTYQNPGEYEVRISDDVSLLCCSSVQGSSEYRSIYAPMIREFITNSPTLETLDYCCFRSALNLNVVNCAGIGLRSLGSWAFCACPLLPERLDFPHVIDIAPDTFTYSPSIAELHFASANAEAISALPGYDTCFGAENAVCKFDL